MIINIKPRGETVEWEFHTGGSCGDAWDTVGVYIPGRGGCSIAREDVLKLRAFLEYAEAHWSEPAQNPFSPKPK